MFFKKFSKIKEIKSEIRNVFPILILASMQMKTGDKVHTTAAICAFVQSVGTLKKKINS